MTLVIDASVAFKWFAAEVDRDKALALLGGGETLIAPDLVVSEVLSALWKAARIGFMTERQAHESLQPLERAFGRLVPSLTLAKRAAKVAFSLDYPVYDAFYIALAEQERCAMITADERLLRKIRGTGFSKQVRKLA